MQSSPENISVDFAATVGTDPMLLEAPGTALFGWHIAACQLHLCVGQARTIENLVLYHVTVVRR